MKNHKFIKLINCEDANELHISIDSIECFFKSQQDHIWTRDDRDIGDEYNFVRLKTGMIFETKETPDVIEKLIE